MENLKKALFGYSRESVLEYIARLNSEFSQKVLDADREHNNRVRDLENRIARLEEENRELINRRDAVGQALIDAKMFSVRLENEAQAAYDQEVRETRERYHGARAHLDRVDTEITELQRMLFDTLGRLKEDIDRAEEQHNQRYCELEEAAAILYADYHKDEQEEPLTESEEDISSPIVS